MLSAPEPMPAARVVIFAAAFGLGTLPAVFLFRRGTACGVRAGAAVIRRGINRAFPVSSGHAEAVPSAAWNASSASPGVS